jgi:hypothetical protein
MGDLRLVIADRRKGIKLNQTNPVKSSGQVGTNTLSESLLKAVSERGKRHQYQYTRFRKEEGFFSCITEDCFGLTPSQ